MTVTLSNVSPSPDGSTPAEVSLFDTISFDVTTDVGFDNVLVAVEFAGLGITEVVHDGSNFTVPYARDGVRDSITGGFRYSLRRSQGWPDQPDVRIIASETGGGGGSVAAIWEWNGVDTSQFTLQNSVGTPDGSLGVANLVTGEDNAEIPALVYTHLGGAAAGSGRLYTINDLPSPLPDRYIIQWRHGPRSAAAPYANTQVGLVFAYQDNDHWFGLTHGIQDNSAGALVIANNVDGIQNGFAITLAAGGFANREEGAYVHALVDARDPSGGDPGLALSWYYYGLNSQYLTQVTSGGGSFGSGGSTVFGGNWVGWSQSSLKNAGFYFREFNAAAGSSYISDLRIFDLSTTVI